jgi:hypothetical protein
MVCELHPSLATSARPSSNLCHNLITPQDVFARLASWTWEGACDARTAGVPLGKASTAIRVTWVIDVSVGCALGAWTVAFGTVPGDGGRLPVRRASRRAFPPVLAFPIGIEGE